MSVYTVTTNKRAVHCAACDAAPALWDVSCSARLPSLGAATASWKFRGRPPLSHPSPAFHPGSSASNPPRPGCTQIYSLCLVSSQLDPGSLFPPQLLDTLKQSFLESPHQASPACGSKPKAHSCHLVHGRSSISTSRNLDA